MENKAKVIVGDIVFNTSRAYLLLNTFHHDRALNGFDTVVKATDDKFTCNNSVNLREFLALVDYSQAFHQGNKLDINGENKSLHVIQDKDEIIRILDARLDEETGSADRAKEDRIKVLEEKMADAQLEIDSLNRNGVLFKGTPVKEKLKEQYDGFMVKLNSYSTL